MVRKTDAPVEVRIECLQPTCEPEELFLRLAGQPGLCYLDSALRGAPLGRYSILAAHPYLVHQSKGDQIRRTWNGITTEFRQHPLTALRDLLCQLPSAEATGLPFVGGLIGYFAYDLGRYIEALPCWTVDDLRLPDCWFACYGAAYLFDHQTRDLLLVAHSHGEGNPSALLTQRMQWLREGLATPTPTVPRHPSASHPPRSNFTREEYLRAVECVQKYIAAGDIYQANLSQRFDLAWDGNPLSLYWRLRQQNAAPFSAYLDTGDAVVLSSSPERFLKFDATSRRLETRPIKGTRPRGATPAEDQKLAEQLFASTKDRAELLMIVDLERNDLGRVCEIGSVRVPSLFRIESYATVHHLVSTVEGTLASGKDLGDLLRATFPGGSITGAPKIRAMEVIEELEPTQRHVYTGAIGYASLCGNLDLNIAIRTLLYRQGRIYFQLGGGIVADSVPALEYEETLDKGRALFELFHEDAPSSSTVWSGS